MIGLPRVTRGRIVGYSADHMEVVFDELVASSRKIRAL